MTNNDLEYRVQKLELALQEAEEEKNTLISQAKKTNEKLRLYAVTNNVQREFDNIYDGLTGAYSYLDNPTQEDACHFVAEIRELADNTIKRWCNIALGEDAQSLYFLARDNEDDLSGLAQKFGYESESYDADFFKLETKAFIDQNGVPRESVPGELKVPIKSTRTDDDGNLVEEDHEHKYHILVYKAKPWGHSELGSYVVLSRQNISVTAKDQFRQLCSTMDTYVAHAETELTDSDSIKID